MEVGGGYGNMAKIFKKMRADATYIIIDIPLFSYIQTVYLKSIFGSESVNMVHGTEPQLKKGKINLVPLDKKILLLIDKNITNVDLFISTWALSESNEYMQNCIRSIDYFKSKYLLMAYQRSSSSFGNAENIVHTTSAYKIIYNEETEYTKDNYYLFAKRK